MLWVQQKESESAFSVAAIPSELNCADIGAKGLTRKRLLGLLYMTKIVDAVETGLARMSIKIWSTNTRSEEVQRR